MVRKAHLKRKAESETFGLANIGLVSTERTNVEGSRSGVSLDVGPGCEKKRARAPVNLSREVFTVEHAGLVKLKMGQGEKASSSSIKSSTPPVAKLAVASRAVAKNPVIFGTTNRELKQKNLLTRVPKRDFSTAHVGEESTGPSPQKPGPDSLPGPGEAHLQNLQTIRHVEVPTVGNGTGERRRGEDVTSTAEQEKDCTNTGAGQTTSTELSVQAAKPFKTRSYQTEMFQESIRRNIILCQGTGSGKTHVAILRIQHEIEHSPPDQMSWFLVPNRHLGEQQFAALTLQLPPVPMRLLTGNDGVEKWDSEIWDEILSVQDTSSRVRIVVSTYQVLLDALTHGFVTMDVLSLIVFDEAHHSIFNHPANRIMQDFYHPRVQMGEGRPAILGLTASPLFNAGPESLKVIETNLHSLCRTPNITRSELLQYTNLPKIRPVIYPSLLDCLPARLPSTTYPFLVDLYDNMNPKDDPYLQSLPRETEEDELKHQKALSSGGTYCMQEMKSFVNRSSHVCGEYGGWAGDFFIGLVVKRFIEVVKEKEDELVDWIDEEKAYLLGLLSQLKLVEVTDNMMLIPGALSPKVETLIDILVEEYKRGSSTFSGIIFVEQRVGVAVLAEILSRHPQTKDIFRCGTLVGGSHHSGRTGKHLSELVNTKKMNNTLTDFRKGVYNLIIVTSVAEEGLDIQACHLVVCCYKLQTKKSYVQMRGRARRGDSTYVLMFPDKLNADSSLKSLEIWEEEMLKAYRDEKRKLGENVIIEDEDVVRERYLIEETKALLTYDSSIPHLHHFCAVIPRSQYTDFRPEIFTSRECDTSPWTAELTLPLCIPPELRNHKAKHLWKSEKMAMRDVAFQAYVALHKNGLVDNNLMPLPAKDENLEMEDIAQKTSMELVPQRNDPFHTTWVKTDNGEVVTYISILEVAWENGDVTRLKMILPFACARVGSFNLWWSNSEAVRVTVIDAQVPTYLSETEFTKAQQDTYHLFSSVFPEKIEKGRTDFIYLFEMEDGELSPTRTLALDTWKSWGGENSMKRHGIIRDKSQHGRLYLFRAWNHEATIPQEEMKKRYPNHERIPNTPLLEVTLVPRRRNFSRRYMDNRQVEEKQGGEEETEICDTKSIFLLPQLSTFDDIPWTVERAALLIPCILRKLEVYAVAKELQETLLTSVGFSDLSHIVTAITASSASEETNYQRYELLGDSVLKLIAGVQLMAEYPNWHEGYLSGKKDCSVANSKLAQESMRLGMSRFIVTDHFSPLKWKSKYSCAPVLEEEKHLSTKMLADVVESLIGAAYLEGSFEKAIKVAQVFGLNMKWDTLDARLKTLYDRAACPQGMQLPTYLYHLETLLGYTFTQKSLLLEAITHPGCTEASTFVSYQRMEFLGDSVLDMVIVDKLFRHENKFNHVDMHLYKSASVNEYFLGFLCLHTSTTVEDYEKEAHIDQKTGEVTFSHKNKHFPLFKFMRNHNHEVAKAQQTAYQNYLHLKEDILNQLYYGRDFPWTLLACINAEKFFSDIIEAILGAIFIDSNGSFDVINRVIDKLGLFTILTRLLVGGVDPRQPVQKLGIFAAQRMKQSTTKYVHGVEGGKFFCEVQVNGEVLVRAVGGVSKGEVQMRAAEMAYALLIERAGGEGMSEAEELMALDNENDAGFNASETIVIQELEHMNDLVQSTMAE